MGGWVVLPFNNSTLLCKCAKIIWCTEKISAPMGRVKTLKGEQLSIVVPTVHTSLYHLCTGLTTLYDFFVSYQTFAQKKENLSISFDMVAMLRLVLSMFFFYPRQWHTDFWCSQFLLSFLNRILFFFFRFCDAPCEKEETAFICASDGSLYRFLLFTKIERFSKHF